MQMYVPNHVRRIRTTEWPTEYDNLFVSNNIHKPIHGSRSLSLFLCTHIEIETQ